MNIGKLGLALIKSFEKLRLKAYLPTPNDVPTIGWGHTSTARMGQAISKRRAEALLLLDLRWVEAVLMRSVRVPLNQNQYDALCSFVFNIGGTNFRSSTLLKKLNSGDYLGAANELPRWNKQKRKVLRGLTRRRSEERALFLKTLPVAVKSDIFTILIGLLMSLLKGRKTNGEILQTRSRSIDAGLPWVPPLGGPVVG